MKIDANTVYRAAGPVPSLESRFSVSMSGPFQLISKRVTRGCSCRIDRTIALMST